MANLPTEWQIARPAEEWHDDHGTVLWWHCERGEPPHVGSPLDDDWVEGRYTHWTPLPNPVFLAGGASEDDILAAWRASECPGLWMRLAGKLWERLQADMNAKHPGAKCECGTPIIGAASRCLVCCLRTASTAPQEIL